MISEPFDPAVEATWIARGRRPDHAAILADAWRRFPDLPNEADREARIARMRDRALALRPVMESMSKAAEEERQARNFAFTETKIAEDKGDDRDQAILRARSLHGYDWDRAVRYASGWYAATAGWEPEVRRAGSETPATLAYDQGFADGGGDRDDIFDAASDRAAVDAHHRAATAEHLAQTDRRSASSAMDAAASHSRCARSRMDWKRARADRSSPPSRSPGERGARRTHCHRGFQRRLPGARAFRTGRGHDRATIRRRCQVRCAPGRPALRASRWA